MSPRSNVSDGNGGSMETETQICCDCHRRLGIDCFEINRRSGYTPTKVYRKPYCIRCAEIRRIKAKQESPYDVKIRSTVSYHARRYGFTKKNGGVKAFFRAYNLSYEFFRNLLIAALNADWCPVCNQSFSEFLAKQGGGVMHLDLTYRDKPPTQSNWRWIHSFDNRAKGRKKAEIYDQQSTVWSEQDQCEMELPSPIEIKIQSPSENEPEPNFFQ